MRNLEKKFTREPSNSGIRPPAAGAATAIPVREACETANAEEADKKEDQEEHEEQDNDEEEEEEEEESGASPFRSNSGLRPKVLSSGRRSPDSQDAGDPFALSRGCDLQSGGEPVASILPNCTYTRVATRSQARQRRQAGSGPERTHGEIRQRSTAILSLGRPPSANACVAPSCERAASSPSREDWERIGARGQRGRAGARLLQR